MSTTTRRAVVRTGIWAVPVIATAAAAPAFAGTGGQCVSLVAVISACQEPCATDRNRGDHSDGGSTSSQKYSVTLSFSACEAKTVTIVSWDMTGKAASSVSPKCFPLASGTDSVTFTVTECGTVGATLTLSFMVDGTTYTTAVGLGQVGDCKAA